MERRVMRLSRRSFTKEFKEAAVRRLELGASIAEVARACEVNANVLHRWRRELRDYGSKAFVARGNAVPKKTRSLIWSGRLAARHWRSIFYSAACSMSRSSASCK